MAGSFERPYGLISPDAGVVPLVGVRVTGDIAGRGARVRIAQRFRNGESRAVEAVYKFPLPEGAAVCGFEARVGERVIRGSVEEREKAFEAYDRALAEGHGGFLLDEERPNLFTLAVGNLNPGAEVTVQIDYVTLLDVERGSARFLLPTTIAPRYLPDPDAEEEGIPVDERIRPAYAGQVPYGLSLELKLHQGASIATIESPSHPIRVEPGAEPARVSLTADSVKMDRDFVLVLGYREPRASRAWRLRDTRGAFLQLDLSLPGERGEAGPSEANGPAARRREILFLLDCSGSMQGSSIEEARRALAVCLRSLSPGQRFNLVRFGSTFQDLFPEPREYGEESLKEALAWLAKTDADLGGTELLPALRHLVETPVAAGCRREVIVLTDGDVGNEAEVHALVRRQRADTRFFTVGIGMGPNEHLVRGISRLGGGTSEFIHPGERIEPKMLRLFQKVSARRFDDVRVQAGGERLEPAPGSAAVQPGSPCTLFARAAGGSAGPEVTVSGRADGEEWSWVVPVSDIPAADAPVALLWARERIRDLEESEEALAGGARQAAWREDVVRISCGFGVLSASTAFVAIEERAEADRTTGEVQLRKVPVLVTAGWHGGRAGAMPAAPANAVARFATLRVADPRPDPRTIRMGMMDVIAKSGGIQGGYFGPVRLGGKKRGAGVTAGAIPSVVPAPDRTDLLLALLDLQRAGGGFDLDPDVARRLGFDPRELKRAAERVEGAGEADPARLLHTALVLQVLETEFAAERATWTGLVAKTREWLAIATGVAGASAGGPRVGGQELAAWAAELAARRVRLPG